MESSGDLKDPPISIARLKTYSAELINSDKADNTSEGGVYTAVWHILAKCRLYYCVLHLVSARSKRSIAAGSLYLLCNFFLFQRMSFIIRNCFVWLASYLAHLFPSQNTVKKWEIHSLMNYDHAKGDHVPG